MVINMDYNEIRRKKKGKKKESLQVVATIAAILIFAGIGAMLVIKLLIPRLVGTDIKTSGDQTTESVITEEPVEIEEIAVVTAEPELPAPTAEPVSGRGSMEPIPETVWQSMQGRSWTENPYVRYDSLMYLTLPYYDFNYNIQIGHMVCATAVAEDVVNIFSELFDIKYPIERMEPIDGYYDGLTAEFDTPDRNSMGHNNTSCFCYRVVSGSSKLSNHAFGRAIDLNPKTNPWERNGSVSPRNAQMYARRGQTAAATDFTNWTDVERAACIGTDTEVYRIFRKYGWEWGGEIWGTEHDYQHFQKP